MANLVIYLILNVALVAFWGGYFLGIKIERKEARADRLRVARVAVVPVTEEKEPAGAQSLRIH